MATVEAGIHSRHPEEPAGTHGEVMRGHRELDGGGERKCGRLDDEEHETKRSSSEVTPRCENIVVPEGSWMAPKKLH